MNKTAKAEVNLMSLLSTLEEISDLQLDAEEKEEEGKKTEEAIKLPRTNSLEDLDIKVFITDHSLLAISWCISGIFAN